MLAGYGVEPCCVLVLLARGLDRAQPGEIEDLLAGTATVADQAEIVDRHVAGVEPGHEAVHLVLLQIDVMGVEDSVMQRLNIQVRAAQQRQRIPAERDLRQRVQGADQHQRGEEDDVHLIAVEPIEWPEEKMQTGSRGCSRQSKALHAVGLLPGHACEGQEQQKERQVVVVRGRGEDSDLDRAQEAARRGDVLADDLSFDQHRAG